MRAVSLLGTASYLPGEPVDLSFFTGATERSGSAMFKGSRFRHHVADGESAADMIERASRTLLRRFDRAPADIDLVLTNVSLPDQPFTGCGAVVSQKLGCAPRFVCDLHNSGCVSFVYMMDVARSLMASHGAKTALIANAQTAAGRLFSKPGNRDRPQSAVPGDGCGVGLLVAGDEAPVEAIVCRTFPAYSADMSATNDERAPYWATRKAPLYVDFTEARIAAIIQRGNQLVPEIVGEACAQAELATDDIDLLVTNQPNPVFLRNWREALLLPPERHMDTFSDHGNLFGAAIPVILERAEREGRLRPGSRVVLAGFSHAGDYAAAAVVRWRAN